MASSSDILAPDYLGDSRIALELAAGSMSPVAGIPVQVSCDYQRAEPEGVVLPLVLTVTSPAGKRILERVYQRVVPTELEWTADEGGVHLVRLAERWHNRWFGALEVVVIGDEEAGS